MVFPTPPPVVEELQVQILKLLLNNKDDNGVSGSQTPAWVPGGERGWLAQVPAAGFRLGHGRELVQPGPASSAHHGFISPSPEG